MMMVNNGMRTVPTVHDNIEAKAKDDESALVQVCEPKTETSGETTDSLGQIMNMMTSLFGATMTNDEIKELHKCYHELDKKVYGMNMMLEHLLKSK